MNMIMMHMEGWQQKKIIPYWKNTVMITIRTEMSMEKQNIQSMQQVTEQTATEQQYIILMETANGRTS